MAVRWQDEVRLVYAYYDQEKSEWEKINGKKLGFMHWAYYFHKYCELRKTEDRPLSNSFEKIENRIRRIHPKAWSWASDRYEKNARDAEKARLTKEIGSLDRINRVIGLLKNCDAERGQGDRAA